jgi:uncharacterized membrane protein
VAVSLGSCLGLRPVSRTRPIETCGIVEVEAPVEQCYAAYSDLSRIPEWAFLLFDLCQFPHFRFHYFL